MKLMTVACGVLIAAGLVVAATSERAVEVLEGRYVTHIATDKPIYRVGEKVFIRGVMLRANDHTPMTVREDASFEIKGPKGDMVASGISPIIDSVAGFSWDIPDAQAGGEYIVRILHRSAAPAERKFDIRAYRAPRLKTQIVFLRDGYGPGDRVSAKLHVERAEGGIPEGAGVSVSVRVDGVEIWEGETEVDGSGNASTDFNLPVSIARGEGVIAMVVRDGGAVETAAKSIPILLRTMDLEIYPEGGDLIAGLENRVYVEARTPARKPVDIAGVVVNSAGREVAALRTEHEGRARFSLLPAQNETYSLRITEPAGIHDVFPLPAVKSSGVVLSTTTDVTPKREDIVVRVAATDRGDYGIALSHHYNEIAFKRVRLEARQAKDVAFTVPKLLDGVLTATVFDEQETPIAERLVFRPPENNLRIKVEADRSNYVPGDDVTLRISTTDQSGKPIGAMVGLTVTDSSVLEMIEKREQAPRLPVMVYLEKEVADLSDAHIYLDENHPKAALATDLLLGTQGWRRFMSTGTGVISGIVTDTTGALIPGAIVRATHQETGAVVETVASEFGYVFVGIDAGLYEVSASLPGFVTENVNGVRIPFRSSVRQDFRLEIAPVVEQVEVAAVANRLAMPAVASPPRELVKQAVAPAVLVDADAALAEVRPEQFAMRAFRNGVVADAARRRVANIVAVREYAHARRPNWAPDTRTDFTETVYWNAGVKTNASGVATVSFHLSDAVTSFTVTADGFTADGAIGAAASHVESVKPFAIEPKFPLQITSGDVVDLPIGIVNGMDRTLNGVAVTARGDANLKFTAPSGSSRMLPAMDRAREFTRFQVGEGWGVVDITIDGRAGAYRDTVTGKIDVQPMGFPHQTSTGGMLNRNAAAQFEFTLPAEMVRGSAVSTITVYPTPLASMTDALQGLIREPYGCFEQTSSTSYPMVMAQQYFLTHTGVDAGLIEKTRDLLDVSYKKLTSFESPAKGYEWFGADPGHEALTAYGLLQFTDMAMVHSVDKGMLNRTRGWLLARRDGQGGFSRNARALDSFGGAPAATTNAYVVWALVESGDRAMREEIAREIAAVKRSAETTDDAYIVALGANILHATGDAATARKLMDKLVTHQDASGMVRGAVTSITRSGGDALNIETTALSVLAWMREPSYVGAVQDGLKWIVEKNKSGRFGSTQSTVLALRAIVAFDAANAKPRSPGRLVLTVDGQNVGAPVPFTANTQGALGLPEFASKLGPGKHSINLRMEDGADMPFAISVKYHSALPESDERSRIGIRVALRDVKIQEGDVTEAVVSISNRSDQAVPAPVAIVGIPGGLEVRHDALKDLVRSGRIHAYEVIGREVVLYWRQLNAGDDFDLLLSLVAAVPGVYTGPASRAYLYYTDEFKSWTPGVKVEITR